MAISTEACTRCRRLFKYVGFGPVLCAECKEADEADFAKVKEYLAEHGSATMMEIAAATGINPKFIRGYLRESRLEIPDSSNVFIKCESCGCDIKSGRYCTSCASRISTDLHGAFSQAGDRPKAGGRMHFLDDKRTGK